MGGTQKELFKLPTGPSVLKQVSFKDYNDRAAMVAAMGSQDMPHASIFSHPGEAVPGYLTAAPYMVTSNIGISADNLPSFHGINLALDDAPADAFKAYLLKNLGVYLLQIVSAATEQRGGPAAPLSALSEGQKQAFDEVYRMIISACTELVDESAQPVTVVKKLLYATQAGRELSALAAAFFPGGEQPGRELAEKLDRNSTSVVIGMAAAEHPPSAAESANPLDPRLWE